MSTTIRLLGTLAFVALAVACSSVPVQQDYNPAFDFTTLGSYAWLERGADPQKADLRSNQLVHERIVRAVDQSLASKGYPLTSAEEASFFVTHHIAVDKKIRVDTTNYGYGYGYRGWSGGGYSDTRVRQYEVGSLILDFIAPGEKKELLWRGTGSSRLQEKKTPEERQKAITRVVDAILGQFPPTKK